MTESLPQISKVNVQKQRWFALDDAAEWSAFSEKKSGLWESRVAIEGMHCAACGFAVEKALKAISGVVSTEVNASSGRAIVVWEENKTKPSEWMCAINDAGYQTFPQSGKNDLHSKEQRLLLWRLLVAGFCMMQVMMYGYPAYVAKIGEITQNTVDLMRWASWVLTLPVLLFSSGPFFSNAIKDIKQKRVSMDFPVALGILITFVVSSAVTFQPSSWWGREVYYDSLTMFVFFLLIGRWLEARMRDRTAGSLEALMRHLPSSVERQNVDGSFTRISVRNVKVGNVLRVFAGEAFPADGKITYGGTKADEALLTGESRPVTKGLGDYVIAGSHNLSSTVNMQVEKIGESTQYAQIIALMERVAVDKPRLALLADRIAKPFLLFVLVAAFGAALLFWHTDHNKALMAAVAVLIVTCPCALSLATPAAMLASAGALARNGILVRRLQALEALAHANTIIFDKTGTLTSNQIKIVSIDTTKDFNSQEALKLAASIAQHSLHPISRALVNACTQPYIEVFNVKEILGAGLVADTCLGQVKVGSAKHCGVEAPKSDDMQLFMANRVGLLATFTLAEEIREDAQTTIQILVAQGFKVAMLTGDKFNAAQRVAKVLGIEDIQTECTPQDKLANMQKRQSESNEVVMVGDGLNDGPILAGANVSIAMGQAMPLTQAQSDFVVQGGQLILLPMLILHARKTMRIVKQNLIWAAAYNAICVPLAVLGYLPAWLAGLGMAISSLMVILNALRLSRSAPYLRQTT
ncbi:MAG: heavy metal translocating P-type ATPase [Methylophilaceae bacterium]